MSFGSFHSSNLLAQVLAPEDKYKSPPHPPVDFPKFTEKANFGADMKEKHFFLDKEWTFINHGAFGAALKEVIQAEKAWEMYVESQPVRFIDRELFPQLIHALTRVAKFIDAAKTDVVFVQNATTANNAVIQSVVKTFQPGDSILRTNLTYGTVKKLLEQISKERDIRVDEVIIDFPLESKDRILKLLEDGIKSDTKFAVLDHVPSAHGLVLPIKEMIAICHRRGVQVLVDGAHCFGSLPISMRQEIIMEPLNNGHLPWDQQFIIERDIGADYYVANAHKWFCSPKGCAVLYVDQEHQKIIRPLLVSWGHGYGYLAEFGWTGLMNYCSYLSMHTVLDFWEFYGPDNIRSYLYRISKEAGELLTKSWGTRLLADCSFFAMMVTVELPDGLVTTSMDGEKTAYSYKHAVVVQNALHHDFKIEVPIKALEGKLYVRISVHVYNTLSEYQYLADAINKIKLTNACNNK